MTAEHTSGPWTVAGFTVHAPYKSRDGQFQHVCDVDQNEQGEANARLIAAAPQLLAALNDLVNVADREVVCNAKVPAWVADLLVGPLDTAKAAIAKAEK